MSITLLVRLFLLPLFHERTILVGGAEIHIDAFDPVAFKAEKLRIAKTPAAFCQAFVGHKSLVALDDDLFQFVPLDPIAIAPAALEIGRLVDPVVIRGGKTEIIGEGVLNDLAIVRR
jgi:hypothetical protein